MRRIRESKGMTLDDVSEKVLIGKSALSRIENGKQNIYDSQAIILADFFKVSIDHLLGREWAEPDKIVIKEAELTYEKIFKSLGRFDNKQLSSIIGACEFLLQTRENGTHPQVVQNTIDKFTK